MLKINDGDEIREMQISDLIHEFEGEIDYDCSGDIDATEYHLIVSQYAYIKFGLILERVRNQCWWRNCVEKFRDFKQFCQAKVNLSIWQVLNAIKSAQVCVKLVNLGYTELPRNASQALKMSELPEDKLAEVWGKVLKSCEGHKITALAIESQIHPDKEPTSSTIRLPAPLMEKLQRQAANTGVSLAEYLGELVDDRIAEENKVEPVAGSIDTELESIVSAIAKTEVSIAPPIVPAQSLSRSLDSFNDLMNNLLRGLIPPVNRRFARE
ncbi:hypothetical protein [Chamaesiphon sp. VAR_48_metabat_403]|uniref:hypothetical protein n=1 Tax=Chamaesiphon sp. VAR_48_metabat_403 TaxID=2964700 RepID=UPI00286D7959|nr:hypothetical protein [Chamaesiphon sp. VAR_48_metabat_403]